MCRVTELRVIDVLPESEAARKGVKVGDVLVAVDMKAAQVPVNVACALRRADDHSPTCTQNTNLSYSL